MKNKMQDVRDHLVQMMEQLNDSDSGPEVIERAKAMSGVAGQFIAATKVEIEAARIYNEFGLLPSAISGRDMIAPTAARALPAAPKATL